MKRSEGIDFDSWFDVVKQSVMDQSGIVFRDADSVREDYDEDKDAYDVADEIVEEYGE